VRVGNGVAVAVIVWVGLGVAVASRHNGAESLLPSRSCVCSYSSYSFTYSTPGNCFSVAINGRDRLYPLLSGAQRPVRYTRRIPLEKSTFR
jgi:hypothetical protein